MKQRFLNYSVLNATTGSLLAATRDGISPAIKVSAILIATKIIAPPKGNEANPLISDIEEYQKLNHTAEFWRFERLIQGIQSTSAQYTISN